jgi:Kdo2-lipid IVA lauroyltransferase/acyltransferase
VKRNLVVDYLVYLVVRILICIVQATPIETGQRLARGLAWLFSDVLGIRRKVVDDNLQHAFAERTEAERRRLARQMWEHLFLLVIEVAHVPRKIHETNWRRYARLVNVAPLVRMLIDDRPAVIVTGHFGNFEVGGYLLGVLGFPTFTVARTLDNRYLNRFVNEFRGATGQYIISKNDGFDDILAVMGHGGTMAFLADQYAGPKGCWVEFFGRQASVHKAIALLAVEHDAPVAVCYSRRLESPMHFEMVFAGKSDPRQADSGVGSIRDLTQWYTARLEEGIRQTPDQYWWLHRRWKDPRPTRRKAA